MSLDNRSWPLFSNTLLGNRWVPSICFFVSKNCASKLSKNIMNRSLWELGHKGGLWEPNIGGEYLTHLAIHGHRCVRCFAKSQLKSTIAKPTRIYVTVLYESSSTLSQKSRRIQWSNKFYFFTTYHQPHTTYHLLPITY